MVILSPRYRKYCPDQELAGLISKERAGRKVILPVWHERDVQTVVQMTPSFLSQLGVGNSLGYTRLVMEAVPQTNKLSSDHDIESFDEWFHATAPTSIPSAGTNTTIGVS